MAYDPVRQKIVLFGGESLGAYAGLLADTWVWDRTTWIPLLPAVAPTPRTRSVMAFDGVIQKVVLFSGYAAASTTNDTWLWDGSNWVLHAEAVGPDTQWHSAMTYDAARQQLVLLSHYAGDFAATWIYANNAAQQFVTLTVSANPAAGGTVSNVSGTHRAGETVGIVVKPSPGYEFQGWSGACSGSQISCYVYLATSQTVTANFGAPLSWLKLNPGTNAATNESQFFLNPASMVYDSVRKQIVYFGGTGGAQTWTWNGTTWTLQSPAHSPSSRGGAALAFDEARQRVVLFGGGTPGGIALADTWTWDGTDWTLMSTPGAPPVRVNHSMAYDRTRQEVVLFGGWDYHGSFTFRTDTWVWNGTTWTQRVTPVAPPGRSDFGMAYDPVNRNVVLTPGAEGGSDTWTWDGSAWTQQSPAKPLPNVFSFQAMAFDEHLQRMVLVIESSGGSTVQTWVWDGSNWTQLAPVQSPSLRSAAGVAYDGVRGQILLFGGDTVNDTWVLSPPAVILTPQAFSAAKNALGNYLITTVLKNTGNAPAISFFALNATLGAATSSTITSPQFITIAPGASANVVVQFPAAVGAGAKPFSLGGGYSFGNGSTGLWSAAVRAVVLP